MMTAAQKAKWLILLAAGCLSDIDESTVDDLYEEWDDGDLGDAKNEVRGGQFKTGLPCDFDRNYESKSVASKTPDGSWVGWTYWYGGGKHGCPEEMDWIDDAYDLTCTEEEKLVIVRTFAKAEQRTP